MAWKKEKQLFAQEKKFLHFQVNFYNEFFI